MKWAEAAKKHQEHTQAQKDVQTTAEGKQTTKKQYVHNEKTSLNRVP